MERSNHPDGLKIGLETHVTLNTMTKLFCGCSTKPAADALPNSQTCPTCLGLPGSKPRLNAKAVELGVRAAEALGFAINPNSIFARKTYYYPDLSKNYQITQYDQPLGLKGCLKVAAANAKIESEGATVKTVDLTRLHIEEDPAQIVYPHGNMANSTYTLLDYNRSGMPLLEIVTEPCLRSPAEAKAYLEELFRLLAYLGVIDAKAERVMKSDANISIAGGERVEIKNITSFAAVEKALQSEFFRQKKMRQLGKPIERQTRLYSEETDTTLLMRTKEQEEDYGYIVEPDLPPLTLTTAFIDTVRRTTKELPTAAIARLQTTVPAQYAPVLVYQNLLPYLESSTFADKPMVAKWLCGDFLKAMNYNGIDDPLAAMPIREFDALLTAIQTGKIHERAAKEYIKKMVAEHKTLDAVLAEERTGAGRHAQDGNADATDALITKIITDNPKAVAEYRAGKPKSLEFLVGQFLRQHLVLHPNEVRELFKKRIEKQ
ncbi:Asp-tRNA(Asn)/Glu-tRNA(Gln) amidotransferase subunit GatB [Candidatus Micrarchaeota archaeon]|nr:Asp-tRNA(Asn)/Glu-tRNA(Gln) amidotransferase subunit GatB [Candidatus Micrarchaeota archaeon]